MRAHNTARSRLSRPAPAARPVEASDDAPTVVALPRVPTTHPPRPRGLRLIPHIIRRTVANAWRDRVLGLSAEAGFWALLSLPPLLLAVVGSIGYVGGIFGPDTVQEVHDAIIRMAGRVLAPTAVDSVVKPVLHDVLNNGHGGVVSIGFLLALWAGSTAMSDYVNTITIAYDMRELRSAVRSRLLAFALYLGGILVGTIALPLLVVGPTWLVDTTPTAGRGFVRPLVHVGYWPVVALLSVFVVATLYHLAVPARTPWRRDLPGAVVAMLLWLLGSYLLRLYLSYAIQHSPTYAGLGAPIAALLFLYVTALAILLGAELNAEIDRMFPSRETALARCRAAERHQRQHQEYVDALQLPDK